MNRKKNKIFITADDFGVGHEQNVAIDYAMKKGLTNQASLIVNSEFTKEAVQMAKEGGYSERLCLHLTLTTGAPLSEKIKKIDFYCKNGKFIFRRHQGKKALFIPKHIKALREEFEAQINRFQSYGLKVSHIDSHHYIHLNLPCMLALRPLIKKYHIRSVRSYTRAGIRFGQKRPFYQALYYRILNVVCRVLFPNFVPYAVPCGDIEKQRHITKIKKLEIYLHPCICNGILYDRFSGETIEKDLTLEEAASLLHKLQWYEKVCYNTFT